MLLALLVALAAPSDWVPARWKWTEPKTLDLLNGTPINCLLLEWDFDKSAAIAPFAAEAGQRGIAVLGVIHPGADPGEAARGAIRAKLPGVVLEGDFPPGAAAGFKGTIVELTSRKRMKLGNGATIAGTYQGVWPGIQVLENGAAKAGPTGSPWIDTNSGFIRAVRAFGNSAVWLGNQPPSKTVIRGERYLQAICDAAIVGARWIVALDDDFAQRLRQGEPGALQDWRRMAQHLKFFEDHRQWRSLKSYSKLAVVQDLSSGALLSGGILDMIATKHTPVRAVPRPRLSREALEGSSMAVNVDADLLTPEQREILRSYTRSGGTLLTAPPGWKDQSALGGDNITLEKAELDRLNDIWREVQSMIGRRNLGARLFNVSSMLSNLLASDDGKQVVVHLVNYSSYPVESVAVHLLGEYKHARLYTPEGVERDLEVYKTEDGAGVDIDSVSVCATIRVD